MTRCNRCNYNNRLKSSAYNPSGQRHEVQLMTYNSMTNHLRRVLLAKSVVDCGKVDGVSRKNSRRASRTSGRGREEVRTAKESLSQNVIDRLAYDTKYHPNVVAKMSWRHDRISSRFSSRDRSDRSNSPVPSDDSSLQNRRVSSKHSEEDLCAICAARLTLPAPKRPEDSKSTFRGSVKESKIFGIAMPRVTSSAEISCPEPPEFGVCVPRSTSSVSFEGFSGNNEVSMYVNFVYDMTKEIMDMGYYADEDIEAVFERHFKQNLGRLNKEKMLQEINCLKKALSVNCESDEDDEDDAAVVRSCGRRFCSSTSFSRASGTLKNSKERVKRDSVSSIKSSGSSISSENKSSDIIVTQEDVINTLLDMDLKPDKAEEICKSLKNRSKEPPFGQSREWNSGNNNTQPSDYSSLCLLLQSVPIKQTAVPNAEASRIRDLNTCENESFDNPRSAKDGGAAIEADCVVEKKAGGASVIAELETKKSTDDSRLGPKSTDQRCLDVDSDLVDNSEVAELSKEIESESDQDAKSDFDSGQPAILQDE